MVKGPIGEERAEMNEGTDKRVTHGNLTEAMLVGLNDLRLEVRDLEKKLRTIQRELERARNQLVHAQAYMDLEQRKAATQSPESASGVPSRAEVCDNVERILRGNNKEPMHYRELEKELRRRGVVIGGKKPENGLVSRIYNDKRFVRPARRGYYALREDYPDSKSIGERKKEVPVSESRPGVEV